MCIDSADISVVVQGPIDARWTGPCLASIRRHLPRAEIILSTWAGSAVPRADVDHAVLSDDPGAARCTTGGIPPAMFNVNRQIVSTVAGLRSASRPLAMKIRTDMEMTGTGFLRFFDQFPARSDELRVFEQRVVACTRGTQSVRRRGLVLHPCDWFHFGRRQDLLTLWDVPLDRDHEVAGYFANRPRPAPDRLAAFTYRFAPEQFIWIGCLRKSATVTIEHLGERRPELLRMTDLSFANNFVFANERDLGVHFRKYAFGAWFYWVDITLPEWKWLYRRYCDPAYRGVSTWHVRMLHVARLAQIYRFAVTRRLTAALHKFKRPAGPVAQP